MDLLQRAGRGKRDLHTVLTNPESASIRHATESFDAFVDGVVK